MNNSLTSKKRPSSQERTEFEIEKKEVDLVREDIQNRVRYARQDAMINCILMISDSLKKESSPPIKIESF